MALSRILNLRFAFFGTPRFAEIILNELEQKGFIPALVVTAPDKPKGRKLLLTPSEVKIWAKKRHIPVLMPEKLSNEAFLEDLKKTDFDLFIVAAYGKIIPKVVLDLPRNGVLFPSVRRTAERQTCRRKRRRRRRPSRR